MGLGALVVVIVLVVAGVYMPGKKKASAAEALDTKPLQQAATTTSQPPPQLAAAGKQVESKPADLSPAVTEPKPAEAPAKKVLAKNDSVASAVGATGSSAAAASKAELDATEHEVDQLTTRAAAVNSGLDNLQRQQAASGYGLRGDIAAKQASMNLNLSKAGTAIQHNDAARAKKYADMTSTDVEALEKFLGR
jgi:hypothetical protein